MPASTAVRTARAVSRSCSTAAACAPIAGIRRVLAKPGIGALARIATSMFRGIAVRARERVGPRAQEEGEPQPPHEQHGPDHALRLPALWGCRDPRGEAKRPREALQP